MYDINLPISDQPITGQQNDDYFNQHRDQWEQEILTKLETLGLPVQMWSFDPYHTTGFIHHWKSTGVPRSFILVGPPMDKTPYDGPKMPEEVQRWFNASFSVMTNALFCITKGEDWWPHEKAFVCNDARSYMLYLLYTSALRDPKIMEEPEKKKLGRPRNEAAHVAKAEKTTRYQQWLADCEEYRAHLTRAENAYRARVEECEVYRVAVAEAENAYREAKRVPERLRLELSALRAQSAPKWIP